MTMTFLAHVAAVVADRHAAYGSPARNLADTAARWSVTLGVPVTPEQVALCMIDLKLARLSRDPAHLDSITDVAGYAACLADLAG
jgi:hypothetical protein